MSSTTNTAAKTPWHPTTILALAVALPGVGHVALGQPTRGFGFAFFSILFALFCWQTTTPEHSFIGRTAGGLFVWALSIPDAYRIARERFELWQKAPTGK